MICLHELQHHACYRLNWVSQCVCANGEERRELACCPPALEILFQLMIMEAHRPRLRLHCIAQRHLLGTSPVRRLLSALLLRCVPREGFRIAEPQLDWLIDCRSCPIAWERHGIAAAKVACPRLQRLSDPHAADISMVCSAVSGTDGAVLLAAQQSVAILCGTRLRSAAMPKRAVQLQFCRRLHMVSKPSRFELQQRASNLCPDEKPSRPNSCIIRTRSCLSGS